MSLDFIQREQEGIEIVSLQGRLTFGPEDLYFRKELASLVQAGKTRVVMNLNHVSQLDTTGSGTLVFAQATLRKAGGGLALVDLQPSHLAVLVAAKLASVFELFKEDQDAINSFFPGRQVHRYDILEFVESRQPTPTKP